MRTGRLSDFRDDQELVDLGNGLYADHDEWVAEQRAKEPPAGEILEEEIARALAAGVSRERIRRHLDEELGDGGESETFFAALTLRRLHDPRRVPYSARAGAGA